MQKKSFHKLLFCCMGLLVASSCVPWKAVVHGEPTINDAHLFYNHTFAPSDEPFVFPQAAAPWEFDINDYYPDNKYVSFDAFLQAHHTTAFLVIHRDSIVYERYFDGYEASRQTGSFSMAKSYVSAMVGIAIEDGYITSVEEPVTNYLPFLKPALEAVRLADLLNMRAGLDAPEEDLFLAKLYYSSDLQNVVRKIGLSHEPNTRYEYQSAATQLLSMAVERASGKKFADYFREKIWNNLNMEFAGNWSSDSEAHDVAKGFCCLNSTAHDFAKFGRLYMQSGRWQGRQVVPAQWVEASLTQHYPDSRDRQDYCYNYCWRVVREQKEFFAKGILGQIVYADKDKDILIVRLGEKHGLDDWPALFRKLGEKVKG